MIISLVVAMDHNRAIGRDNALPWQLPADLRRFKAITMGKPMLMGRRTAESLGRALPGRENLVLTRSGRAPFDGMVAVASVDEAIDHARTAGAEELCVIGGGQVFEACLPIATHLRFTYVDTEVKGADAWFPAYELKGWRETFREMHPTDGKHTSAFTFVDYERA
ncbi:dihydrofolate reductase [Cognatilysobacter bugurensis]|uniref:Dihydrofolate reductase n=1 Tax=Cognatilysobacter bugurensis TaxID=543356 RepID=A0A918T4E0_9GAMM|nr:dihydrofolate reductase [Lysobacter bugurensis]GHA89903.1 dihydrofolate reductase [Lysobacter bugurensis]